jgi:hypothetical protein
MLHFDEMVMMMISVALLTNTLGFFLIFIVLKFTNIHVAPLVYIILIASKPVFPLTS